MKIVAQIMFRKYLDPGEKVLEVCHRHFFIILGNIIRLLFFGFLIPLFLYYLFQGFILFFVLWIAISFI